MRVLGVIARVGTAAMLVVSAVYVMLYLYRWEWNRAMIAGVFFLAAEIAAVGIVLADRLRPSGGQVELSRPTVDTGPPRFGWLEPDRLSVFVPVLIGAGAIVSLGAYVIERVARATAPAGPSPLLAPLWPHPEAVPVAGHRRHGFLAVLAVGLAAAVLAVGLREVADLAQARAEPPREGWQTVIDLEIRQKRALASTERQAERLILLCVPERFRAELAPPRGEAIELVVTPAPGRTDRRKLVGCLADVRLDRVLVDVERVSSVPTG